eukprot:TRINITY_DN2666_c0_g1_i5.p2 TRINITY_DN2666_c0_g1~~TRINITY_DN2666_c0_g1_i5.p2  ORF type:complete len:153 (-),score=39.60 TRINITY_DN2666_c0_g1_i5:197-655(-)
MENHKIDDGGRQVSGSVLLSLEVEKIQEIIRNIKESSDREWIRSLKLESGCIKPLEILVDLWLAIKKDGEESSSLSRLNVPTPRPPQSPKPIINPPPLQTDIQLEEEEYALQDAIRLSLQDVEEKDAVRLKHFWHGVRALLARTPAEYSGRN